MSKTRPFLLLLILSSVSSDIDLRCTPEVCSNWLSKNECPTISKDCLEQGRIFTYPVECGCCDYCISYLEDGDWCDIGQPGQPTAPMVCGGGLGCYKEDDEEHGTCQRLKTPCHDQQDSYDMQKEAGLLGHLAQRPLCDDRGQYAPVTCVPDSVCYCVNTEGERIFGEALSLSAETRTSMRCDCSRDAYRASQLDLGDGAFFAHCLPDGSYDPLQCVDGNCACVDSEGGIVSDRRVHVGMLAENSPKCFNASLGHEKGRWARECERQRYDKLTRDKELRASGVIVFSELPNCGLDGRFERIQSDTEWKYCSDEDGVQIEDFRVERTSLEASVMNCHCARTRYVLQKAEQETGLAADLPDCCPNGNFKPWQCVRGLCYCVDANGRQLFQEVAEENVDKLKCYKENNACPVFQNA